jgi:iron complex transport system ATP-binding protein
MALAQGTKILFLDEPTTYLDIRYQLQILKLIRQLNCEFGITIVMVLHDINQSLYYSDEIVAMKDGCHEGRKDHRPGAVGRSDYYRACTRGL